MRRAFPDSQQPLFGDGSRRESRAFAACTGNASPPTPRVALRSTATFRYLARATQHIAQAAMLLSPSWLFGCDAPNAEAFPARLSAGRERSAGVQASLGRLRSYEQSLLSKTRFEEVAPVTRAFGPDPHRVCDAGERSVGLLRGEDAAVLLNDQLDEVSRCSAPRAPVACAKTASGEIAIVGELAREVRFYGLAREQITQSRSLDIEGALSPRALAVAKDTLFVADAETGKLHELRNVSSARPLQQSLPLCLRPTALEATEHFLIASCLLDHALVVRALDASGHVGGELTRIVHDGPFWSLSALEHDGELIVAAGGVEDHPLERFDGAFGYVDSFVYLYRFARGRTERLAAINTSDHSVLTPKALSLTAPRSGGLSLFIAGYGSQNALELFFSDPLATPSVHERSFIPGVASLRRSGAALIGASPLHDAFVRLDNALQVKPSKSARNLPSESVRLGEALFYTELIAPDATSSGMRSRFTCETCHFEGGIDGRVHATGRHQVRVSTRPLFGLLQNRPHFSRALDPDLTSVSHNEFRVASLGDRTNPWFSVSRERFPWLQVGGDDGKALGPEALRRALIDFLALHQPVPNPHVLGRKGFTPLERQGASLFADTCERCHSARVRSDDPSSSIPFGSWEALIFSEASPLVWARGDYASSGIVPSVHPLGTRIPSLRRIARKYPYFTDGSALSLGAVLERARDAQGRFFHAGAPPGSRALSTQEVRGLLAFLTTL